MDQFHASVLTDISAGWHDSKGIPHSGMRVLLAADDPEDRGRQDDRSSVPEVTVLHLFCLGFGGWEGPVGALAGRRW